MGFSASTTHMIFFIAAALVATSLVGVFADTIYSIQGGIRSRGETLTNELSTKIEIINDPNNMPYSGNVLTIYVKNIGENTLDQNQIDILIDGVVKTDTTITILDDVYYYWSGTVVIKIEVNNISLATGDHSVKVTINGVADKMDFRI